MFNMHGYCKYKVSISNVVTLDGRQIEIEYDDVCGEDEDECDDGRGENEDDDDADSYTSTRYVNDDATDNDEDIDYEDDCELQEEVKQEDEEIKEPTYKIIDDDTIYYNYLPKPKEPTYKIIDDDDNIYYNYLPKLKVKEEEIKEIKEEIRE